MEGYLAFSGTRGLCRCSSSGASVAAFLFCEAGGIERENRRTAPHLLISAPQMGKSAPQPLISAPHRLKTAPQMQRPGILLPKANSIL
ncbi:hypothetical protein DHX103_05480 [Planococcus sp. X10-3]|uniref:hypothetical protein n=1 Tax=Planococcus sp. X10-3 TaxID=3061240 RepID=UPI003BB0CE1E